MPVTEMTGRLNTSFREILPPLSKPYQQKASGAQAAIPTTIDTAPSSGGCLGVRP